MTHLWKQENSAILRVEVIVRGMERVSRDVVCKTSAPSVVLEEPATSSFAENCVEHSVKSSQAGVLDLRLILAILLKALLRVV